ncbi:hypothetical protein ACFWY6_03575 [Streptomyces sp. NPDC059037]|uniref:hypothetical protein n=1 Tax=Streptomyces sp. NPDC059037 TaxID=3346710 RepID=UPI0036A3A9F2
MNDILLGVDPLLLGVDPRATSTPAPCCGPDDRLDGIITDRDRIAVRGAPPEGGQRPEDGQRLEAWARNTPSHCTGSPSATDPS